MNVVDSSAWLEYFAGGANAGQFGRVIEDTERLIVPAMGLYEVFKRVLQQKSESEALQAVAAMQQGRVVDMDSRLAIDAARISITYQLPMADSVMLSTARQYSATLWTQDARFKGMEGVEYRAPAR